MKHEVEHILDMWAGNSSIAGEYYGIFWRGTQLVITQKRIYKQPGRARVELVSVLTGHLWSFMNRGLNYNNAKYAKTNFAARAEAVKLVDELIKDGTLEIKKV